MPSRTRLILVIGSPPQVWGKRISQLRGAYGVRFTPTGVGKTPMSKSELSHLQVHPHRCGENVQEGRPMPIVGGSPPQVWGKPTLRARGALPYRFTPTGVGKTAIPNNSRMQLQVHPHRCGENTISRTVASSPSGSPPQVWGKRPS